MSLPAVTLRVATPLLSVMSEAVTGCVKKNTGAACSGESADDGWMACDINSTVSG